MESSNLDSKTTASYESFSLVKGGLIYSLTKWVRKLVKPGKELVVTAISVSAIIWLPLLILTFFEGLFDNDLDTINFVEDFLLHIRFLVVVPFLILIENMVDRTFVAYIKNSDNLIPDELQSKFNQFVMRLDRLTDSYVPEIIALVVFYVAVIIDWQQLSFVGLGRNFLIHIDGNHLKISGWYYVFISMPVYQLFIVRWLWRWVVWVYSVIRITRFKIQVDPLHADGMAGLEYLNMVPLTFSFILMSPSAVLSAQVGIEIIYNGAQLSSYIYPIAIYIFLLPIILYSPLLFLIPVLIKAKTYGIFNFGNLIRQHNIDYAKKWMGNSTVGDVKLLGTMDNSSLADINGSYAPVQSMKIIPLDIKLIVLSFVLNILPYIPLVFTYYSLNDLFEFFIRSIAN